MVPAPRCPSPAALRGWAPESERRERGCPTSVLRRLLPLERAVGDPVVWRLRWGKGWGAASLPAAASHWDLWLFLGVSGTSASTRPAELSEGPGPEPHSPLGSLSLGFTGRMEAEEVGLLGPGFSSSSVVLVLVVIVTVGRRGGGGRRGGAHRSPWCWDQLPESPQGSSASTGWAHSKQVLSRYSLSSESAVYILDLCKNKIVSRNQVPGLQGSQRLSAGHVALHPLRPGPG